MSEKKTVLTNFFLTSQDRSILEQIAEQEGVRGMASVVRKLIREEGRRRNLLPTPMPIVEAPSTTPATLAE